MSTLQKILVKVKQSLPPIMEPLGRQENDALGAISNQFGEGNQSLAHPALKLHYFQGVLDAAFMAEQEG